MDDLLPERHAAYRALRQWAKTYRQRDAVIRAAVAAGIDQRSIQQITGIARTTIGRICAGHVRARPSPDGG